MVVFLYWKCIGIKSEQSPSMLHVGFEVACLFLACSHFGESVWLPRALVWSSDGLSVSNLTTETWDQAASHGRCKEVRRALDELNVQCRCDWEGHWSWVTIIQTIGVWSVLLPWPYDAQNRALLTGTGNVTLLQCHTVVNRYCCYESVLINQRMYIALSRRFFTSFCHYELC